MQSKERIAAYTDMDTMMLGFKIDGQVKTCKFSIEFVRMLSAKGTVVTIGEWAAEFGLLEVIPVFQRVTFKTLGFSNLTLEEKVEVIDRLAVGANK